MSGDDGREDVTILDILANAEHNIAAAAAHCPKGGELRRVRDGLSYALVQAQAARSMLERGYPPNTVISEEMFSELDDSGEVPEDSTNLLLFDILSEDR